MHETSPPEFTVSTTPERVELARRTHRRVHRTLVVTMGLIVAVILGVGIPLSWDGVASLPGVIVVAAAFIGVTCLFVILSSRTLRNAERFLSSDGTTYIAVGSTALTIGDVVVPYERITCIYAHVGEEQYSSGGLRGEAMAYRMGASEDRPTVGRAAGALIGTSQRRRLYREGAKSTISLAIGIDRKSEIAAPDGMINPLRTLPKRGDDPGRIDIQFGAYFGRAELEQLLAAVRRVTGGTAFPIAIVRGTLNWAQAAAVVCEPREKIWQEHPSLLDPA